MYKGCVERSQCGVSFYSSPLESLWQAAIFEEGMCVWLSLVDRLLFRRFRHVGICHFLIWCPGSGVVLDCINS